MNLTHYTSNRTAVQKIEVKLLADKRNKRLYLAWIL